MNARIKVTVACCLGLLVLGVVPSHTAQGVRPGAGSAAAQSAAERLKAHVTILADDLLEGREAGTRGHEIAANYIAAQFASLGVKPAGDKGGYLQRIQLQAVSISGVRPEVAVDTPGGRKTFTHGEEVVVRGPVFEGEHKASVPLVFVGYGIKDPVLGIDDYAGLDVRGKGVVVLFGQSPGIDSEVAAHLRNQQARIAAEQGAVAVVQILSRASLRVFPWAQTRRRITQPVTTWVGPNGKPFDSRAGVQALVSMDHAAAASLFEGSGTTLASVLDEAETSRPKSIPLQTSLSLAATTAVRRFTSPQVVGVIEGADPVLKDEYVALVAHADHIGVSGSGEGDRINNGALDNAAGVATLLEVARNLTSGSSRPRRSVLLVALTAEEKGQLGSSYFARNSSVPIGQITAVVNLDMPILLYDFTDVVAYGGTHSTLQESCQAVASDMGLRLSPDPVPNETMFVRSDHYQFVQVGIPSVMVATGRAGGGEAAWKAFQASSYHQPSDDLAQPIDWSAAAKFAMLNERLLRRLADADGRPMWYQNDYFGQALARSAQKARKPTQ